MAGGCGAHGGRDGRGSTARQRGRCGAPHGVVWRAWTGTFGLRIPVSRQTFRPRAAHNAAVWAIAPPPHESPRAHTYAGRSAIRGCPRASHDRARGRYVPVRGNVHALHTIADVDIARDPAGAGHGSARLCQVFCPPRSRRCWPLSGVFRHFRVVPMPLCLFARPRSAFVTRHLPRRVPVPPQPTSPCVGFLSSFVHPPCSPVHALHTDRAWTSGRSGCPAWRAW